MSARSVAPEFNIVLLYEHSALLAEAIDTCSHLKRELAHEFTAVLRIWRIDVATSAEFAVEADRDIAAAEVIVIGVRGNQLCPPAFWRWKEAKVVGPGRPHGAIIAIVEAADEPGQAGETWNSVLRGGATQVHPEIFVREPREEFGELALPQNTRAAARFATDAVAAV